MRDGERYQREEQIPWSIAIDDLRGTVHQVYGGMADPTYLIDATGRVAFYNMWTHVPTLHRAITALQDQGGIGTVLGGIDHVMHFAPAMTEGWRGIERGLWQSYVDLETAAPGTGVTLWLGYQLRGLLAPMTQRSRPLPVAAKAGLTALGVGLVAAALWRSQSTEDY